MPANDRVLIEIITAANLAGVEQAQKSFLGLGASTIALAAVLGVLIKVGKDAIENYNNQEGALNLLHQATDAAGLSYGKVQAEVESFIETNKGAIANQYDVIAAMGQVVRAGHNETESLRILNDALDFAVIKHEDVSAAATTLIRVLAGNSKALKELGITTEEYNAIMKSKMTQEEKDAALLALIEKRTAHGRDTVDTMTAAQHRLNTDWENFTARIGPGVVYTLDQIFTAADTAVQILDLADQFVVKLGQDSNNPLWGDLQDFLVMVGNNVPGLQALIWLINAIHGGSAAAATTAASSPGAYRSASGGTARYRAAGGPVSAGMAYTVGEQGPETLVMGARSGSIIPNGGGGGDVHHHWHIGTLIATEHDFDRLGQRLLRGGRYRPGT